MWGRYWTSEIKDGIKKKNWVNELETAGGWTLEFNTIFGREKVKENPFYHDNDKR